MKGKPYAWLALCSTAILMVAGAACGEAAPSAPAQDPALATALGPSPVTRVYTVIPTSLPLATDTLPPSEATPSLPATAEPAAALTPTLGPSVWAAPYLPPAFVQSLELPAGMRWAASAEEAGLVFQVGGQAPAAIWVYALVAPFPSLVDGVTLENLRQTWKGEKVGPFAGRPLLMDVNTVGVFEAWWGRAATGSVKVIPAGVLLEQAWESQPAWAVVPFEALEPRWKVLEVDGQTPLGREFDPDVYPLSAPISMSGSIPSGLHFAATNRHPDRLTVLVMTGVTALVRGTANALYAHGPTYPIAEIGPWLQEADITHISNEVPFAENCPLYDQNLTGLRFCTHPSYIELMEAVGTDVVELTGDHFADWGPQATLYTLELYRERGWPYYGGGANLADARQPVLFEHNGNQLAFLGCNAKGGGYATADDTTPGAAECDFEWLEAEIGRLRQAGYLPIFTFQHEEIYSYMPPEGMQADFYRMAEAGAVIVSGSQAHQPHGLAFSGEGFIHFGLGNLFFDQLGIFPDQVTDRAFIDRHIFYEGRHLATELLTIQFVDYARSRPLTSDERRDFLGIIFDASGW